MVSTVPAGSLPKAALVGANTVNGSLPSRVVTRPAAFTAATSVVWSLELTAFWMMFFEGNIAAPPTMTVFSPDISLFIILSCALTGATTAAVRASAPKAADKNAMRLDMDGSPVGLSGRRMSAGDEGNNDAGFVDGQTASPLRRVTGGFGSRFHGINFCGFETFLATVRARLAGLPPGMSRSLIR